MRKPLYQHLSSMVQARLSCIKQGHEGGSGHYEDRLLELVKAYMPYGSGFNAGTNIDLEKSTGNRLVFTTDYQWIDEHGGRRGWTSHTITVTPAFNGFDLRVTKGDADRLGGYGSHDYLEETIHYHLSQAVDV